MESLEHAMPDWIEYVRSNLRLSRSLPEDEANAVEEIARQLEDAYLEALQRGLSAAQAEAEAKLHIIDWKTLSEGLPCNRRHNTFNEALRKEELRRMGIIDWIESLARDVRHA